MVAGAALGYPLLSGLAASLGAVAIVAAAAAINGSPATLRPLSRSAPMDVLRRSTLLVALVYAWGSAAMLGVYTLSGLAWQHGWQYGAAMAIIAAGIWAWAGHLANAPDEPAEARRQRWAFRLAILHASAASGALVFLFLSGKLWAGKSDWAANQIFLAGGLAIVVVSIISACGEVRLFSLNRKGNR